MALPEISKDMIERKTIFSDDRRFRYTLWREFQTEFLFDGGNKMKPGFVMFIGLNPSTANETEDDPTIRRCIRFSKKWGYGAYCMTNLFAFCTAYPKVLTQFGHPIGEPGFYKTEYGDFGNRNDYWLHLIGKEAGLIIAAWGAFPQAIGRANYVQAMLAGKLFCLGKNADGSPKHPLYLRADSKPIPYNEP